MINILPTFDPSVPVSEEAKDFISKLLIVDEEFRISVKDIDVRYYIFIISLIHYSEEGIL
jgi:hypothetical protein